MWIKARQSRSARPLMIAMALGLGVVTGAVRAAEVDELWPAPPLAGLSSEDLEPAIDWQEDWRKTSDHMRKIWDEQLSGLEKDERDRRMRARMIHLRRQSIEHFPREDKYHLRARFDIADDLGRIGARTRQMIELRSIIEEHPGDFGTAASALDRMLSVSREDSLQQRGAWMEYAVERIAALGDGGYLRPGDDLVLEGFASLMNLRREQGRFADAGYALREWEARRGRSYGVLREEIELLLEAGRRDIAHRRMEEIRPLIPRDDSGNSVREQLEKKLGADTRGETASVLTDVVLEGRYDVLKRAGTELDAATAQSVFDNPESADGLVPVGPGRLASAWHATVRLIAREAPAVAQALMLEHGAGASAAATAAGSDDAALLAAFRRFPWSMPIHEAMVAAGERSLWRGDFGVAYRWFEDAASMTTDEALRDRARVGGWLALAQTGAEHTLAQALAEQLETARAYPWIDGGTIGGAELQRQLEGSAQRAAAQAAGGWNTHGLTIPPVDGWAPRVSGRSNIGQRELAPRVAPRPIADASGMNFVAGLSFVSGYLPGESAPLWTRTAAQAGLRDEKDRVTISPAAVGGCAADGRVFTRWAPDGRGVATTVAAFDARSGDLLWSAASNEDWGSLQPAGDPVAVDGQVVVPAITGGLLSTAHVVSLDAATGEILWRQSLGTRALEFQLDWRGDLDVAHFGNAVTVDRGSIYLATNLGVVARLDQRDGAVEWMTLYERSEVNGEGRPLLSRWGASPMVIGEQVVVLPRDIHGAFALDRRSGAIVWERPLAASEGAVGSAGGAAVLFTGQTLVALDAATGETRWRRDVPSRLTAPPLMTGDSIYAATPDELLRIDPLSGRVVETRPLREPIASFEAARGSLLVVSGGSADATAAGGDQPRMAPGSAADAQLPWGVRLHLDRSDAKVIVPPTEVRGGSIVLLRSGMLLEALDLSRERPILWRRALESERARLAWSVAGGGTLVILEHHDLQAVSLQDGTTQWRTSLPGLATGVVADQRHVAVATLDFDGDFYAGMFDVRSGRLRWQRSMNIGGRATTLALRGDALMIGGIARWGNRSMRLVLDVGSGGLVSRDHPAGDLSRIEHVEVVNDRLAVVNTYFTVHSLPLLSGQPEDKGLKLEVKKNSNVWIVDEGPGWVRADDRGRRGGRMLLTPLDDPTKVIETMSRGAVIRGRWVLWPKGQTVEVFEAGRTEPAATLTLPEVAKGRKLIPVTAEMDAQQKRVVVASRLEVPMTGRSEASQLRLDVFERSSGKHVAGHVLPNVTVFGDDHRERTGALLPAALDVVWTASGMVVTGPFGVDVVGAMPAAGPAASSVMDAARLSTFDADGDLAEWAEIPGLPMPGMDGGGMIRVAHDGERLLIAVSHPQPTASPYAGDRSAATGSRLEVAVTGGEHRMHFAFGLDANGRVARHPLAERGLPDAARLAARYDAAKRVLCYELSVPLARPRGGEPVGVSVSAWRGGVSETSPHRYLFGNAMSGSGIHSGGYRPVKLPESE